MERLSFSETSGYDGLEAAIHLTRYALARELCKGRSVLDLACGEGYGSRLLADWGASRVIGVDVSKEAIEHARALFATSLVEYRLGDADSLLDMFPEERFDLIVSLETIEHVKNPEQLLSGFHRLLNPGGVLVLSCPNDWWYYPSSEESNPYHRRKYTFEEFRNMTQATLGPARAWYLGGPHAGFINVRLDTRREANAFSTQALMLHTTPIHAGMVLPAERSMGPTEESASYFVGFWTDDAEMDFGYVHGAATLPLSMDAFKHGFFAQTADTVHQLRQQLTDAREQLARSMNEGTVGIDDAPLASKLDRIQKLHADLTKRSSDLTLPEDVGNESGDAKLRYALLRERACEIEKEIVQRRYEIAMQKITALEDAQVRTLKQERWLRQTLVAARAESSRSGEELQTIREELQTTREKLRVTRDIQDRALSEVQRWSAHAEALAVEAQRYRHMRDVIPPGIRRLGMKLLRIARRMGK